MVGSHLPIDIAGRLQRLLHLIENIVWATEFWTYETLDLKYVNNWAGKILFDDKYELKTVGTQNDLALIRFYEGRLEEISRFIFGESTHVVG